MSDPVELTQTGTEARTETPERRDRGRTVRHPGPKEYIRIAAILGLVTAMEIGVYYTKVSRGVLVPLLFAFAFVKFSLVVLWFMHLRFDSRTYARFFVLGLAGAFTLYIVVLLTFGAFSR